ncbi:helix-turn-helix domain-containing protein [Streptomyces sp. SudanB182_2057]|uniref:helix-turn-helix domain-containing protein n=1 Tax=Streptomyces sp. SudanB182_2057 TaxID=3035281 RepID=UPI003F5447B6
MPKIAHHGTSVTSAGNFSGPFITLPWPAGRGDSYLYLGINVSGGEVHVHADSEYVLEPGDLILAGALRPDAHQAQEMAFFRVPLYLLDASAKALREGRATRISGSSGLPALVSQFLTSVARTSSSQHVAVNSRLALNTADLVALLVNDVCDDRRRTAPPESELLQRIRKYIQDNLANADMSPEVIARAHHISVRYLHKLFQADGTTVGSWIRQRRLDACRMDLRRRRRTVAAVAQHWGFTSPSHFSRVFRQTYGITPKEWQESSLNDA